MHDGTHSTPLGLIAGGGQLPALVADSIRDSGREVCCVGIRGSYDPTLPGHCDSFAPAGMMRIGRWLRILRRHKVQEAIMVGRVEKQHAHDPFLLLRNLPDLRTLRLWRRRVRHDKRTTAILSALADELASEGIGLIDSTAYITDHLATAGVMGTIEPGPGHAAIIERGWPILLRMIELDVGQALTIQDRDVLAVEATEGTDAMIERTGTYCRSPGWALLKTSSADHDMRSDVPTIGPETVARVAEAGGRLIAVGAGRVIMLDKGAVIEAANRHGIALLGVA